MPPHYDSLLAKIISRGDRDDALARLRGILARCDIRGVATNLRMHALILARPGLARGGVGTDWLERVTREQTPLSVRY